MWVLQERERVELTLGDDAQRSLSADEPVFPLLVRMRPHLK